MFHQDRRGMTPLCLAAQGGFVLTCKYLLSAGASVEGGTHVPVASRDLADPRGYFFRQ